MGCYFVILLRATITAHKHVTYFLCCQTCTDVICYFLEQSIGENYHHHGCVTEFLTCRNRSNISSGELQIFKSVYDFGWRCPENIDSRLLIGRLCPWKVCHFCLWKVRCSFLSFQPEYKGRTVESPKLRKNIGKIRQAPLKMAFFPIPTLFEIHPENVFVTSGCSLTVVPNRCFYRQSFEWYESCTLTTALL